MDIDKKEIFYDKLTYIYIELANFHKEIEDCTTLLDKWLFCLKNLQNLLERPSELQGRVFERLFRTAEISKFKPQELKAYEQSVYAYRDIKNGIDTAKREGEAKGREEGLKEGREEGRAKEKIETAQRMKAEGMDLSLIAKFTGLSVEEIAKI